MTVMDALNGFAWADDVQVVIALVQREWHDVEETRILATGAGANEKWSAT